MRRPHPENAPGAWYVEEGCCTLCAIPEVVAPDLFAWAMRADGRGPSHCYVARQPTTESEMDRMLQAAHCAEFECIRYRGRDARVAAKLCELGAERVLDLPAESPPR